MTTRQRASYRSAAGPLEVGADVVGGHVVQHGVGTGAVPTY